MRLPQHTSHIKRLLYTHVGIITELTICAPSKLVNGTMVYAVI